VGSLSISKLQGGIYATITTTGELTCTFNLQGEISTVAALTGGLSLQLSLRGISTGLIYTQGMLGALKGFLIPLWIPTAEEGTSNILDWIWPYPDFSECLVSSFFTGTATPDFSLFETDIDANMPVCFRNDFYYRIHVTPKLINLGAIFGDTQASVTVWNTYFTSEILEDIIKTGDTMTIIGPTPPFTFLPLWWEEIEFQIPGIGAFSFTAEVDFDFGIIDECLHYD
jgi:hypothetical protein